MKHLPRLALFATSAVASIGLSAPAAAAPVFCEAESTTLNYMSVNDSEVSTCLAAGTGNIGQAAHLDQFLTGPSGAGWVNVSEVADLDFSQDSSTGSWSFDSAMWDAYENLAIGFKFGTGNKPNEWFVYSLQDIVSSGNFAFFNVGGTGGSLSHLVFYVSGDGTSVPEPGTLALLGLGLAGMAVGMRRRRRT